MFGPIWTCAVVGITRMSEDVRRQFLIRKDEEQRAWNLKSNPRIPIDVYPKASRHFYALGFLEQLLERDGFVNMPRLVANAEAALGSEFDRQLFYITCQNLADEMIAAGAELEFI